MERLLQNLLQLCWLFLLVLSISKVNNQVRQIVGLKYELGWLLEGTEFVTKYDVMGGESFIYTDETELLINFLYSSDLDSVYYLIANDAIKQDVKVNGLLGKYLFCQVKKKLIR